MPPKKIPFLQGLNKIEGVRPEENSTTKTITERYSPCFILKFRTLSL